MPRSIIYGVLLVLVMLLAPCAAQEAVILVAPESVNATLNTTAAFQCIGIGIVIEWVVNGDGKDSPEALARRIEVSSPRDPDGTINSTLTIPATMDNDNITIFCKARGDNGTIHSPVVILRVQGLLDSVPNLAIDRADDYNHILMWDPPPTLDITDVHPDISTYTVCDNATSSCQNTSDTHYVFPTLCDPVEFTVSAWNPVGEGERVSIVHEPPGDVRRSTAITSLESEVSFKSLSEPVVTLLLQVDGNCFSLLNTEFRGQYSGVKFENMTPTMDENGTAILTFSENINADDIYTVTITVEQEPGIMPLTSPGTLVTAETNLTTFDVQDWDIRRGDGALNVTCVFATGSLAQGCRIELVSDGPPHPPSMEAEALRVELANGELEREASTSFTDLEAGTYNVLIYDVGVNGTFDLDKSLYNELIEIKNFSPSIEPVLTSTSASPAPSGSVPTPPSTDDTSTSSSLVVVAVAVLIVVVIVLVVLVMVFVVWMKLKRQVRRKHLDPALTRLQSEQSGDVDVGSKRMFCCFVRESETVVQVRMSYWEPEAGVRVTQDGSGTVDFQCPPPTYEEVVMDKRQSQSIQDSQLPNTVESAHGNGGHQQHSENENEGTHSQKEGHYSEIAPLSSGAPTTRPLTDLNVQYAEVKGTMNPHGLVYAHLGARPSGAPPIPHSQDEKSQYSQILPHTKKESGTSPSQAPPPPATEFAVIPKPVMARREPILLCTQPHSVGTREDTILTVTSAKEDGCKQNWHSFNKSVSAESPSHSQPWEETEDSEPSILDPGLQPTAPFLPDSGLVVASIPPPHLSSETASPAPGSEIAPALSPPRIMADPDAPPLPPRQGTFV